MAKKNVRVRFAPSPTGHLHLGGVRTALFNWLFARHHNGAFLIRIEDTDRERSKKEYVDSILASLSWLHLSADEELSYQSSFLEDHKKSLSYLLETNQAYRCFCEPRETTEIGYKYDGTCRDRVITKEDLVKPHAVRFRLPEDLKRLVFEDLIRDTVIIDAEQLDDFILMRRDGTPTYNFCVVVDDMNMKITHVIRGEDHISNTPKQILLYQSLGCETIPQFAHLPLILGPSGQRLSKREASVSVEEYRNQGFIADALCNYLARLGWSHGDQEIFSREELIEFFNLKHVGKKGAIFDIQKLKWVNSIYLKEMTDIQILKALHEIPAYKDAQVSGRWSKEQFHALVDLYKGRLQTLVELADTITSLQETPEKYDEIVYSQSSPENVSDVLEKFCDFLEKEEALDQKKIAAYTKQLIKEHGIAFPVFAKTLRCALTGKIDGPGAFSLVVILGKEESCKRIRSFA